MISPKSPLPFSNEHRPIHKKPEEHVVDNEVEGKEGGISTEEVEEPVEEPIKESAVDEVLTQVEESVQVEELAPVEESIPAEQPIEEHIETEPIKVSVDEPDGLDAKSDIAVGLPSQTLTIPNDLKVQVIEKPSISFDVPKQVSDAPVKEPVLRPVEITEAPAASEDVSPEQPIEQKEVAPTHYFYCKKPDGTEVTYTRNTAAKTYKAEVVFFRRHLAAQGIEIINEEIK